MLNHVFNSLIPLLMLVPQYLLRRMCEHLTHMFIESVEYLMNHISSAYSNKISKFGMTTEKESSLLS